MDQLIEELLVYARSAWRFRWTAMAVAWFCCLVGWLIVALQKDVYEASASVFVDTTSELRRLLDDQIVDPNVDEKLRYVKQTMLGSTVLRQVAQATDLDLNVQSEDQMRSLIAELESAIVIQSSGGVRGVGDNTYTITYRHSDRIKAIEVVTALLNFFVEGTLGAQQSSSEMSRRFLVEQVGEYEERLSIAEERLAEFNRKNFDRLPGMQGSYFERLQAETAELEIAQQTLRQARSRKERIEQQLRGERPWVSESGAIAPGTVEARIQQNEARLEELLLRYTESHPDVVAVKESIARLKQQQEAARDLASQPESANVVSNNPVYQALQISLNESEAEIATLQADADNRQRKVNELRGLIDEMPIIEAEFAKLNRDYDVIYAQYQSLLNSLEREKLSREAQRTEQVEFQVIDPPAADLKPVAPLRIALVPAVLVVGAGAGIAVAVALSLFKPVFQAPFQLTATYGIAVLGSVSRTSFATFKARHGHTVLTFALAGVALLVLFAGVFVAEVLGPGLLHLA